MINDMGITVFETLPMPKLVDDSGDNTPDEVAAAEAAAALASVESEQHRTTDPVRMYMREMGSVELLTREGEIEIAKRIEEGTRELMSAVSDWPSTVAAVIAEWDNVVGGRAQADRYYQRLPEPHGACTLSSAQQQAAEAAEAEKLANGETLDDDEEEEEEHEGGLDPEEAQERFEAIRAQLKKTDASVARYGRDRQCLSQESSRSG